MKKVLLYSGGMDSWLINQIWKPDMKVYIDMKTRYSKEEIKRIKDNNEDVIIIDFPLGQWERDDAIIPLRNMYLLMAICNLTLNEDVEICLGATAGDRVLDKSQQFIDMAEQLLNYLYQPQHWIPQGKKVKLNIDFKTSTKTEMLKMFVQAGGKIEDAFNRSFSCYDPIDGKECWACKPCFRKYVSFSLAGYNFKEEIDNICLQYIMNEIYPKIKDGSYGRAEEEREILEVLKLKGRINNDG